MAISPTRTRRWTRLEYERLIGAGVFRPGERLELLAGHLVVSEPQGSLHSTAIGLVEDALRGCFGSGWHVRVQMPIALDDESEPEPDVAVVPGGRRDYELAHPERPALVVEVSESSLVDDRGAKAALYARAGVAEYWIVNLVGRSLEVRREPLETANAPLGWSYKVVSVLEPGASVSPLACPTARIQVADLLPHARYSR
jgi:Uma2 family endonuclease